MKHLFLFISCFYLSVQANAQNVKLYGFVQKVLPGIRQARNFDGNGEVKKVETSSKEAYLLYIATPANSRLYIVEGWLKGERVGLKAVQVSTPVTTPSGSKSIHVLIEKSSSKVFQLTTEKATTNKQFAKAKAMAAKNEFVVVYKLKGKFGYARLKNLEEIEAVHLQ